MSTLRTPQQRADWAATQVGTTKWTGLCEAFTRSCFPFDAMYSSAYLAWQDSAHDGPVHKDYNAPLGVPVFWDITYGGNAPYDHVALSAGGGYCYSTSAGPGSTLAKVGIKDLTTRWGMTYRGWAEIYHNVRVHTKNSGGSSSGGDSSVRAYQERQNTYGDAGLYVDGVDGPYTQAWRSWVKNDAQHYLNYYNGVKGKVVDDGDYGPVFHDQVRTVQSRNGLVVDGILGSVMIDWMRKQGSTGMKSRPKTRP